MHGRVRAEQGAGAHTNSLRSSLAAAAGAALALGCQSTQMDLADFEKMLRQLAPSNGWPLVCEGSPLMCQVFLVCLNPRSNTPFWPQWRLPYGFRKDAWLGAYQCREGRLRRTRQQLEGLVETPAPNRCLETNVFATSSRRLSDLSHDDRSTFVFDFLLSAIRPKVLLVYGRKARKHLERLAGGAALPLNEFRTVDLGSGSIDVLASRHLSYQMSGEDCVRLGERIRDRASAA